MTRYFIDSEFIADEHSIDLVSLGIISEDKREYYAQSCEFDPRKADPWVKENVLSQLRHCPHAGSYDLSTMLHQHKRGQCLDQQRGFLYRCPWRTRVALREEIRLFINAGEGIPELWGYYCHFDYVVLSQLFGKMEDWPAGWPMFFFDLKQWNQQLCNEYLPPKPQDQHHALIDAKWNKQAWEYLDEHQWELLHKIETEQR